MDLDEREDREELGKVKGGKTVMRKYYVRGKNLFSIKRKYANFRRNVLNPFFCQKEKIKTEKLNLYFTIQFYMIEFKSS